MSASGGPTYGVEVFAKLFNLTPRRIQQLAKEGIIPKASRGQYELAPVVRGYVAYLQAKLENPSFAEKISLNAERARKTKAEADKAEMEAAKMRGDLVDAIEMREALELVMSEIKTKLLNNTPTRIAARTKSEKKEAKIKAIAKDEIAASLHALASTDPADLVEES
ncbi:terminase small subunit, Nu1 [uncultured Ruegeria sp.]|uniref:terminase small subunit, Nu1 n=1 Tax=uncultured Ruegeria sp. TaxID=259304 RepID=UPI002604A3AA|nr:terminase small subunit, Nu1 [uncultured Ruegeria sp.]